MDEDMLDLGIGNMNDIEMSDDELKLELELLNKEQMKTNVQPSKSIQLESVNNNATQISKAGHVKKESSDNPFLRCNSTDIVQNLEKLNDEERRKNKEKVRHSNGDTKHKHNSKNEKNLGRHSDGYRSRSDIDRHRRDTDSKREADHYINFKRLEKKLYDVDDLDSNSLGRELAFRLHETKMNLIKNVVTVLGKKLALEIFEETKKLLKQGGLKTDIGDRKRSAGGTFLYLMKSRGYATSKQMKEIYKHEEQLKKDRKKAERQRLKVRSKHAESVKKKEEKETLE